MTCSAYRFLHRFTVCLLIVCELAMAYLVAVFCRTCAKVL